MAVASMAIGAVLGTAPVHAADAAATGSITGRVFNADSGNYLNNAKVTVEGSQAQVFTNDAGEFTLRGLPAGPTRVKVSFAGQKDLVEAVTVAAGAAVVTNFTFNAKQPEAEAKTLVLDPFTVESQRFRTAQEIATNEERAAPNIKRVVALDSLGYVSDGNIGSFVRFLPGVDVGYTGFGSASSSSINPEDAISVGARGFGSENTTIMIDGVPIASGSPDAVSRSVQLDALSVNNASRLEVVTVPTPDMPQNSPGGAINLITRGAFELSRPVYSLSVALNATSNAFDGFKRTPGPYEPNFKTLPNVRLSATIPISKKVGVSFSVASDNKYSLSDFSNMRDVFFTPKTTTVTGVSTPVANAKGGIRIDNPVIDRFELDDYQFTEHRTSGNARIDWRPFPALELRANAQISTMTNQGINHRSQWRYSNGVGIKDWGDGFVTGFQKTSTFNPTDSVQMTIDSRDREGITTQGYLSARFAKGPWNVNAQISASESYNPAVDVNNGHFSNSDVNITPGRMDLTNINKGVVGAIKLYDATGNNLDYSTIATWDPIVTFGYRARSSESYNRGLAKKANLDIDRSFDFFQAVPFSIKVGGQREIRDDHRWGAGTTHETRYIGTTQPNLQFQTDYAGDAFGGYSAPQYWVDEKKIYQFYQANPQLFDENLITATGNLNSQAVNYMSRVSNTKSVTQTFDDYYGMLTARMFHNRLTLITGARQTRQTIEGVNVYNDPTYQFVKLKTGELYRDSENPNGVRFDGAANPNGRARDLIVTDTALRARMQAAGVAFLPTGLLLAPDNIANGTSSNNLQLAKFSRTLRRVDSKRTQPANPQLQLAYNATESIKLQLSWARTIKLPPLDGTNAILVGGSSFQVNEASIPSASPGGDGTISIGNVKGIPEINNAYNAKISWYPKNGGGRYSFNYYYNEIKNSLQTTSFYNSDQGYSELLASMGLSADDYVNYRIDTVLPNGISQIRKGYEIEAVQNLGVIHPWAQGFDVFLTYTRRPVTVTVRPNVLGFIEETPVRAKWTGGVSYSARRYSVQARFTYTEAGLTYNGAGTSALLPDGTTKNVQLYNTNQTPIDLNLQANFTLNKSTTLFASADHVLSSKVYVRTTDSLTGYIPDYFSYRQLQNGGVRFAVGAQINFESLPRLWH